LRPRIYGIQVATDHNNIIDNFIDCGDEGTAPTALIYFTGGFGMIHGNHFVTSLATDGIWCTGDRMIVTNNWWDRSVGSNALNGIRLVTSNYCVVANNFMRGGNGDGLSIENSDFNLIIGNMFWYNNPYGIDIDADSDSNRVFGNSLIANTTLQIRDLGTNTALPTVVLPFVEGGDAGGIQVAQFLHADASAKGWEIDLAAEWAIALGVMPPECQQSVRIKIYAVAIVAAGDANTMRISLLANAGLSGGAWADEAIIVNNKASNESAFAAGDILTWTFTATDDADIDDLLAGDEIEIKIKHAAANAGEIATDAVFRCATIEYV